VTVHGGCQLFIRLYQAYTLEIIVIIIIIYSAIMTSLCMDKVDIMEITKMLIVTACTCAMSLINTQVAY